MNAKEFTRTSKLQSLASTQLWQVSQRAHMLNQMADSWRKGLAFNGHSTDIADDLLNGASDLQQSLIMLETLQERIMAQMENHKPNMGKAEAEKIELRNMGSNGFSNGNYQNHLQFPQVSADGSSRKRIEELKKVIRESLYKQNLLSVPSHEEGDSLSDGPSESSSRSLQVHFGDEYKKMCHDQKPRVDDQNSAAALHRAKTPNLIAKLMGLEDFPTEAAQTTKKQIGSKKCLFTHPPSFDIDMPKSMKQFTDQNRDPDGRKLKEIIDAMHFKGLLKRNYSSDYEVQPHVVDISESENTNSCNEQMDDKLPPIVILKPIHLPCPEREEIEPVKLIQIEEISQAKRMLEIKTGKEQKVMEVIGQECGVSDYRQPSENLGAKEQKIKEEVALKDSLSDSRQVFKMLETKEPEIVETTDKKIKASFSLPGKQKKMEASKTCRRVKEVPKALTERRKSVRKDTKSVIALRPQVETATAKSNKSDNKSVSVKNHTCQTRASQNHNSLHSKPASLKSMNHQVLRNQKRKDKQGGESQAAHSITSNVHNVDAKANAPIPTFEINCISNTARTFFHDLHSPQTKREETETKDKTQEEFCSTRIIVPDRIQHKGRIGHANEANQLDKAPVSYIIKYRQLLLSSPSFLSCAEELFDLNTNQPSVFQTMVVEDGTGGAKLVLDCARELMTSKSRQHEHVNCQLLQTHTRGPKGCTSMDQLVGELMYGIEELRCYSKIGNGACRRDGIYVMLGRDLLCKGLLVNGVWDMGWVNGFSMDDAEQVVCEVQNHVLGGLVEEVILDLLY